ncbi:MAG: DUF6438 domain-containing protein [Bacteroidota bacterium]
MKRASILFFLVTALMIEGVLAQNGDNRFNRKFSNKIDSISQAPEVEALIMSIDKNYKSFRVNTDLKFEEDYCLKLADITKFNAITKADIDNNGHTDMLVIGNLGDYTMILTIMDSGYNKFHINRITRREFQECSLARIVTEKKKTFVEHIYFKPQYGLIPDTTLIVESKKLIYKFDDFVEYNDKVKRYRIEKIEYQVEGCTEGMCPKFSLEITPDLTIKFKAGDYGLSRGDLEGRLSKSDYSKLISVLNYTDFPDLQNKYKVNLFHGTSVTLKITYENGKVKTIHDYGLLGTFGLNKVYQILDALKKSNFPNVRS